MSDTSKTGIRVSSETGDVEWLKASSFGLAYVRASFGTERDARFLANFAGAKDAGIRAGLYHHFRQSRRPEFQLQIFSDAAVVLGYGHGDLMPVLAFEDDQHIEGPFNEEIYNVGGKIMADALAAAYGGCVLKLSRKVWELMDKPAWVFRFPVWFEEANDLEGFGMEGRQHAFEGEVGGKFAIFRYVLDHGPLVIPPPPQNERYGALDDVAAGLELIARGIRRLGVQGVGLAASQERGHDHSDHGHGHGHGH